MEIMNNYRYKKGNEKGLSETGEKCNDQSVQKYLPFLFKQLDIAIQWRLYVIGILF